MSHIEEVRVWKKEHTPMASLEREVNWQGAKPFMPNKDKNSSLKFGLISDERLYRGLEYEGDMHFLTEENWELTIKYKKLDFILVESFFETVTGDWNMALTDPDFLHTKMADLLQLAQDLDIPTIYWFTIDHEYHELFSSVAKYFDFVFCADPKEVELLKQLGIEAEVLLPAVQPAIYNAIQEYSNKKIVKTPAICDGLADVIQTWEDNKEFNLDLAEFGTKFFDSTSEIWQSKIKSTELSLQNIFGTLKFQERLSALKQANVYIAIDDGAINKTTRLWQCVEAASCRLPVIVQSKKKEKSLLNEFARIEENEDFFLIELVRHQKDELYRERAAQKAWRYVIQNHTFSNRMQTICKKLDIEHDWVEYPSAALVTPSYRPEFFERAKKNYEAMNYPNKEWVFVFNGDYKEYEALKERVSDVVNAKAVYVPSELHAGACMNSGFQKANSEFVFRMDDDDYYGANYLIDSLLYTRVSTSDMSGKIFKYFQIEEYVERLFERNIEMLQFDRPSFIDVKKAPNFSFLCGATQWGKKKFLLDNTYPNFNFGSVDSVLLEKLKEKRIGNILILDDLNFVVDRRTNGNHTWAINTEVLKSSDMIFESYKGVSEV